MVGKDVAVALGYSNTKDALLSHIDEEDRRIIQRSEYTTFEIPNRGMTIINESGLYSLVLSRFGPSVRISDGWNSERISSSRFALLLAKFGEHPAYPKMVKKKESPQK